MADTKKKSAVNPNLKENLCCALFFLLIPLYALINNYSLFGCIAFGVVAVFVILRYAVFDAPDEQLAVAHFGTYFAAAMIGVLLINLASFLPTGLYFNIDANTYYDEESVMALAVGVIMIVLKIFVFKSSNYGGFNRLCRLAANHVMVGAFACGLILTFQENSYPEGNIVVRMIAVFTLIFLLVDSYEQYRLGFAKHHKRNIGASILLYVLMLAAMLCFREINTLTLMYDCLFVLFKQQYVTGILIYAILVLFCVVCYIVCFKGPFASQEVRTFTIYMLFALTMYRMMLQQQVEFGWLMLFVHTAILVFALFYKGKAGGKLERTFAGHKEYRVAFSGIVLLFAMIMLRNGQYLAMAVLLAFAVVLLFVLTREKDVASKAVWQIVLAGCAVFAISQVIGLADSMRNMMAIAMVWFMPASALFIFNRSREEKKDRGAVLLIGITGIVLQFLVTNMILK